MLAEIKGRAMKHQFNAQAQYPAPRMRPAKKTITGCGALAVRMPNHLGDAVMALPALSRLRGATAEGGKLTVIAPAYMRELFRATAGVDEVLDLASPHRFWSKEEINRLKDAGIEAAVLLNNSLRDVICMKLAGVKRLYGAGARGRSLLLSAAFELPNLPKGECAKVHQANIYSRIAEAAGAPELDGGLPEFRLPRIDMFKDITASCCRHPALLTLAPGAAFGDAKRWPEENFRAVAEHWLNKGGIVAALGSKSETATCVRVLENLDEKKCVNFAGKTGLIELMTLLKYSKFTVANDSGIMHLAAALGKSGVAVFGPTDLTSTGPLGGNWSLLYNKFPCSPCYRHTCPDGVNRCIRAITPEAVNAEIDDFLQNNPL